MGDTRRAYRARYNAAKRDATKLLTLMAEDPDRISGFQMAFMRETAEAILQAVHEFNAYRNVVLTHGANRPTATDEATP